MVRGIPCALNLFAIAICSGFAPSGVYAIGPGTINGQVNISNGDATVVGATTINSLNAGGISIFNATGTLDPTAGPSPGPIVINAFGDSGYGISINGTAIIKPGNGGVRITTTGGSLVATGIVAQTGFGLPGILNADGVSVTTSGSGASGIWVDGLGSSATLRDTSIATGGGTGTAVLARGLLVTGTAGATISDSSIRTTGTGGAGVYVYGLLSNAIVNDVSIATSGNTDLDGIFEFGAHGVSVAGGGRVVVNGGTIDTSGAPAGITGAYGVLVDSARATISGTTIATTGQIGIGISGHDGATVQAGNVTINTSGDATGGNIGSYGINMQGGSSATVSSGSISTSGTTGVGLRASGQGSVINATGTVVETFGADGSAAVAKSGGAVALNGTVLTTHGEGAYALVVDSGATAITQSAATGGNAIFTTTGTNADAVRIGSGSSFAATNATLHTTGPGAIGMTLVRGLAAPIASGTDSGSGLALATTPAAPVASSLETANLTDTTIQSDQAAAIAVIGPDATVNLTRSAVSGATAMLTVTSGPTGSGAATVNANASALTGAALTDAASTSTLNLSNGSTWNVTGNSILTNLGNNASLIAFTTPAGGTFKTLTATSYAGSNGVIGLNTVLGADGSPSDKLIILGGTASGVTGLRVANAGGTGGRTQGNGILVVDTANGGTTAPGAFTLDGRAVAGAYEYGLFRGAADASNPDAWYLRSQADFRPEIAAYLANQRLAGQMFVQSLDDRAGESQNAEGQGFSPVEDRPRSGWLRVVGNWEGTGSQDSIFKTRTSSFLLQGGTEVTNWNGFGEADRGHLGLMGSYGYASTDANARGNPFSAKGNVEGGSVGAYGTWYQNDERKLGAYVDTWFQYGWFSNRVEGEQLPTVNYNAQGWAISGEAGYAMPLQGDWVVEPQGQIIYVGYNEGDITEPNGTRVTGADSYGVITRLGARLHGTFVRADGRRLQPYATVNWWHTSTGSSISFNDLSLGSLYPDNRYELKLGLNADLGKRWTGWGNVSGAWGAQSFYQYALRIGVKYIW